MRSRFLAFGLIFVTVCPVSLVLAADDASKLFPAAPPPTLNKILLSEDGKTLQLMRLETCPEQRMITKTVPKTVVVVEGGQEVTKTVNIEVAEKITVTVCKPVWLALDIQNVELRSASGGRHKQEDIAQIVGKEPTPVIVLQRELVNVDGKMVAKTMDFDRSFLQLFKPETLVVVLPPPVAAPVTPPAGYQPNTTPPAPVVAPAPVISTK